MNKICTDIKQSEKLKKLGISINTADMYWNYDIQQHKDCLSGMDERFDGFCTPAWSLTALLELIHNNHYMLRNSNVGTNRYNIWIIQRTSLVWTETPLDAAFEVVCWLLENKKL